MSGPSGAQSSYRSQWCRRKFLLLHVQHRKHVEVLSRFHVYADLFDRLQPFGLSKMYFNVSVAQASLPLHSLVTQSDFDCVYSSDTHHGYPIHVQAYP